MENESPVFFTEDDLKRINENVAKAAHHAAVSITEMCSAITYLATAATIVVTRSVETLSASLEDFSDFMNLRLYATDRQWHLMNHGSPKVRKKWRNALRRKARIAEKRYHE